MKINTLETHDRLLEFNKNAETIYQGCMDCLRNVPDSITFPFYIYAHSRQIDYEEQLSIVNDSIVAMKKAPTERLIWSPRITKPKATSNSYLFLVLQRPDLIKTIWLLPKRELWPQYAPGKMTFSEDVWTSIQNYKHSKAKLEAPDPDGPMSHHEIAWKSIYAHEAHKRLMEKQQQAMMDSLYEK
jgi:hypothetical protein